MGANASVCAAHEVACAAASLECHENIVNKLPVACVGKVWDDNIVAEWKLLRASAEGDTQQILEALQAGADVETRGEGFVRPRSQVDAEVYVDMEDPKADPADGRGQGLTPLMRAAKEGHHAAVILLLESSASPNARDEDGMAPLHFAAIAGSRKTCEALLAACANPAVLDDDGRDAFACLPRECTSSRTGAHDWAALLRTTRCQPGVAKPAASIFGRRL